MYKRRIDLHQLGASLETINHELTHAFTHELCITSCSELSKDDVEEFYAELISKYGRQLLDLGDAIMAQIIEMTGEQFAEAIDPKDIN